MFLTTLVCGSHRWHPRSTTWSRAPRGAGSDFDLDRLVALCPPCHAKTDAPYTRGRLIITALGAGRFTAEATRGADKWAIRAQPGADSRACPESAAQR